MRTFGAPEKAWAVFLGTPGPDFSTDSGFAGFATIGMELADRFNLEGEIGYASADLSERTNISELTAMANVTLELPLASSLDLVLGGGLGISNYSWDSWAVAPPSREESDVGMA